LPQKRADSGPELIPGVEIVEVLPAVDYPAILELEDDAVANKADRRYRS